MTILIYAVLGVSALTCVSALIDTTRGARASNTVMVAATVCEVFALLQLIVGVLTFSSAGISAGLAVGYLLTAVVLMPAGVFWGIADHSRWGTIVISTAAFAEFIVQYRLGQIWGVL